MSTERENLKFYKGLEKDLPAGSAIEIGALYHCTDTGNTYIGIENNNEKLLNLYSTAFNIPYGVCSTAADIAKKTVTVDNFQLKVGATVIVKFTNSNSIASPTLNVNNTGDILIYRYGTTKASTETTTTGWIAGAVQMFTYDGTGWIRDYWNNTTYTNASLGQGYATCSTAAATAAKIGELSSYSLATGGIVSVKFTNAVPANATLNINDKGAKAIYYRGSAITADIIKAGDIATFIYSSRYHLISIDRWQKDIESKQATITGAATTVTNSNLTASRVLTSDASGKIAASSVTSTELGHLSGVKLNIQTQLNEKQDQLDGKQATITGAATSVTTSDLTPSRVLTSNENGKITVSDITSTELGYLNDVKSNIQDQLNGKQTTITGAATSVIDSDLTSSRVLTSNASGKIAVSAVTSAELSYLDGVTSNIQAQLNEKQTQLNGKQATITGAATSVTTSNLTEDRVLTSDKDGKIVVSDITSTELSYLDGVKSNIQDQLDGKQATITDSDLTGSRALISNEEGKITVSTVTSTELGYLGGVTRAIQTQLNGKQATITGAATTVTASDLEKNRALISNSSGKIAVSAVTSTELGYLDGVTGAIQTQLNGKQATITGAATTITTSDLTGSRALVSNSSGKIAASDITSTELGYLDGVTSNIQTQLNGKMAAQPRSIEFSASADGSVNEGFIDWHFNGSSADYTSRIIENASGSLQINEMTVKNGEVTATTFKGSLNGTATNAVKDGEGNTISSTYATNSDHKIKHYTSLSQIGLTEGSETLETICANLPNNSILRCNIGESSNQDEYPASGYGTLVVNKVNGTRCYLEFHGHTSNAHYYATVYNGAVDEDWERLPRKAEVDGKQATITGAATTVTTSDLTENRALVSNANGKIAVLSTVTSTELGYLSGVTKAIQTQLNGKQATITGAATTVTTSDLTKNRALISNASGKIAVSTVTSTELGYLSGVTKAIQTQLNGKQATIAGAATTVTTSDLTKNRALISNADGKIAVSAVTSTELGYLDGVTSAIQTQLDDKLPLGGGTLTGTLKAKAIIAESTLFLRNTISKGTTPTSSTGRYISFVDKDGTDVKNRLGMIYGYVSKSGDDVLGLYSYKPEAGNSSNVSLSIYYPKTGDTYAKFTGKYFEVNRMVASCLLLTNAGGEIGYGSEDPSGNVPAVQGRVYFRTI